MGNRKKVFVVANVVKEHILKFHIPTIKEMTKRGWTVDVGASGDETVPYCHQQYSLPHQRSPFHLGTLKSIWKLRKILKSGGYDIVYCHTPVGNTKQLVEAIYVLMKDTKKKQELVEQASANLEQYHSQKIVNSLLEIIEQTAMK